jgi:hypothetical protein
MQKQAVLSRNSERIPRWFRYWAKLHMLGVIKKI